MIRSTVVACVLSAALTALVPVTTSAQAPTFLGFWATSDIPIGMAIGPTGLVYVGTQHGGSALIHVYDLSGTWIADIGGGSPEIYGLGFLHSGELLAAHYYDPTVDLFSLSGTPVGGWQVPSTRLLFLAVDNQDNVYLTDDNGDRVRKVSNTGAALAEWASPHPAGVAYLDGMVYVAGMWNGLMSICTPDGTPTGSFPTGCTWAEQLCVDAVGNLLLADHGLNQLKCFRPDGTLLWTIGPHVPGYGPSACDFFSVASGSAGTILAGDYTNRRVLVFGSLPTSTTAATWGSLKAKYRGEREAIPQGATRTPGVDRR